ncbi:MAG: hypothetical protein ABSF58_12515 [Solirubrobacteraceae bacterium]
MSERVTISFADADRGIQGVAIAGVGTLLKVGDELSAAPPPQLQRDGEAWGVAAGDALALTLTPIAATAEAADAPVAAYVAAGSAGRHRVEGLALLRREREAGGLALERSLTVLFDAHLALALHASRPRGAGGHGEEQLEAILLRGEPLDLVAIEKPRLSSTYGADGRLTHAGLELWESEESELPLRIGGEALAGGELGGPDGAPVQVTFVDWHHDGRRGLGSYTIARGG